MFTTDQIRQAHSKVKSGADFPAYIRDLKVLGITHYESFVANGHTDYFGENGYSVTSPAMYELLEIANKSDAGQFAADLKAHQNGETDYPTFCVDCAKSGVEKSKVNISEMTCTYLDRAGNEILTEKIPS